MLCVLISIDTKCQLINTSGSNYVYLLYAYFFELDHLCLYIYICRQYMPGELIINANKYVEPFHPLSVSP